MIRNGPIRVVTAALIAGVAACLATVALSFLLMMVLSVVYISPSPWAGLFIGVLLLAAFGGVFGISFRETIGRMTPEE